MSCKLRSGLSTTDALRLSKGSAMPDDQKPVPTNGERSESDDQAPVPTNGERTDPNDQARVPTNGKRSDNDQRKSERFRSLLQFLRSLPAKLTGRTDYPPTARQLLKDVKTIVAFACAHGYQVPDDVHDQLTKVEEAVDRNSTSPNDIQTLNKVMARCLALVTPLTLQDARNFYSSATTKLGILPFAVNLIALYLIVIIVNLTTDFNIGTSALTDLSKIDLSAHLGQLQDTYDLESADKRDQAKIQANIKLLRANDSAVNTASSKLAPLTQLVQRNNLPNWCVIFFSPIANCRSSFTDSAKEAAVKAESTAPGDTATLNISIPSGEASLSMTTSTSASTSAPTSASASVALKAIKNSNELQAYGFSLGLSSSDNSILQGLFLIEAEASIVLMFLGSSILPLFYGLLGASVYLMRQFFGDAPQTETTPTTLGRVLLRLGLGGIAGLAIGWFWTPSASKNVSDATMFATTPFALAFLAGFSIELLFSILDRVILAITPGGKPIPPKSATS